MDRFPDRDSAPRANGPDARFPGLSLARKRLSV
jgi:hypothetical protein